MSWSTKLFERRNKVIAEAQSLLERADTDEGFSAEDKAQFDRLTERAADLNEQVETAREFERLAQQGDRSAEVFTEVLGLAKTGEAKVEQGPDHNAQLLALANGVRGAKLKLRGDVYQEWSNYVASGATPQEIVARALSTNAGSAGVTIPTLVESRFFDVLVNVNGVRKAGAEVWTTMDGVPLDLPKAADAGTVPPTSAQITQEAGTIGDADPSFTAVRTEPVKVTGLVELSRELIEDSATQIEGKVGELLGRNVGWKSEFLYNNGTGSSQPKGIFNAPPAAQTITTATKGALTYNEVVRTKFLIDDYPMSNNGMGACWSMRKATFGHFLGITGSATGNDHPIFTMGTAPQIPDTILGDRVVYNQFAGAVDTANAYLAVYGDFYNGYLIRDVGTVEIDMDESVNFKTDQIVYRAVLRTDGKIINSQLFSYLREKSS